MNIDEGEMNKALQTGLKLLTSPDIAAPNEWNVDLVYLQNVFVSLLTGNLVIVRPEINGMADTDT